MNRETYIFGRDPSVDRLNRPRPQGQINLERDRLIGENGSNESINHTTVCLRMRPVSINDSKNCNVLKDTLHINNGDHSVEKHFTFSTIFDGKASQGDVYESCIKMCVEKNENLTVLMYGTSGSGKTYTIMGDDKNPGVIPRAIEHLFQKYDGNLMEIPLLKPDKGECSILSDSEIDNTVSVKEKLVDRSITQFIDLFDTIQSEHEFQQENKTNCGVLIWISFIEIYNEFIYDLLDLTADSSKKRKGLRIMSNDGKAFIKNLTSVFVSTKEQAMHLLTRGLNLRLNAATNINNSSSRSHCIFQIDVIQYNKTNSTLTSYKFCDLAGSERCGKTGTTGNHLREAQNINNSLLVLGRCLDSLYNNQKKKKADIIPYRDSKLTTYLQSALQAKEHLTMVAHILPTIAFYDENMHVLNFASLAREIVYKKPIVKPFISRRSRYSVFLGDHGSNVSDDGNLTIILDENFRLKERIEELESDLMAMEQQIIDQENVIQNKLQTQRDLLCDQFDERLKRSNEFNDAICEERLKNAQLNWQFEIQNLEARIARRDKVVNDCYAEIDQLEEDNERLDDKNKKLELEIEKLKIEVQRLNGNNIEIELPNSTLNVSPSSGLNKNDSIIEIKDEDLEDT